MWSGLIVSNLGGWMQILAQGWLVVQLAHTASEASVFLGFVGLARALPIFLFSFMAGTIIDRSDRRAILMVTQSALALCSIALAVLTQLHVITLWHVLALSLLLSTAQAFDAPARQSMIPMLVGKDDLMNAIGLNSTAFNAPAVIGPALGGLVVTAVGIAPCFYINAASYVAVLAAVALIKPKPAPLVDHSAGLWRETVDGLRAVRADAVVFAIVMLSAVLALAVRPYLQLMPELVKDVLHGSANTLGLLMAASGVGALAGALATALLGLRANRGALLLWCAGASGALLVALSFARPLPLAAAAALLLGAAVLFFMGLANTLLQTYTPMERRGRVMSLYTMTFLGFMPLGTWLLGSLAALSSLPLTLAGGGVAMLVVALLATRDRRLRTLA